MADINKKIIQRAIAKAIVNDTSSIIAIVNRYDKADKNITYADLLYKVQNLIDTSNNFVTDLTKLLISKKYINDFNNADGETKSTGLFSGGGIGVISGVSSVFTSIVNAGSAKKDRQLEQSKISSQNTAQMMNFMMQEEQLRASKEQSENTIIYLAVGAVVVITGIIIFTRKT
jgi:hypothetical protein